MDDLHSSDPPRVETAGTHLAAEMPSSLPRQDSAVAVTGMACRFAGAESLEELWEILETGTSLCRDLPTNRFPESRFERRSYSRKFKANTIDDVDAFDHKFFKVPSREATFMDPQQRLALQVTYQALESSGYFLYNSAEEERDMGCYFATCTNEYAENVACHPPSAFSLTGSIRPFIAGKLSHHFRWTGPALMCDTACAASGTAIHLACQAVAREECNGAVAGATNIFVSPDTFQNLACGQFTSPTGASKSFDASADGYCRGEGVAVVVLKKLSRALQDGDPILGVIASTAVNQNLNESSITVPHGPSQMKLYRKALRLAGLEPKDVSYVEAHGTGTPLGDPIEAGSIRGVFGDASTQGGEKTHLGSLKSNIGHTEATSGLSGLIKVLLMMQKGFIPPQALLRNINPAIPSLKPYGMDIARTKIPWNTKFKTACVNNYGASGTNAVMVVTQPPRVTLTLNSNTSKLVSNRTFPISITAFSQSSLRSYCSKLIGFIHRQDSSDEHLAADICYHLSRRRNPNLPLSMNGTISSLGELKRLLQSVISEHFVQQEGKKPVVLFFGGQTGRRVTVPRALYDSVAIFRKHLDECDTALRAIGGPSLYPGIFESGSHDDMTLLHAILFSEQYASAKSWIDCGLKPSRLIGHSFGQLTALCVSGVISLEDALHLVTRRANLIQSHWGQDAGAMIAVEAELDAVTDLLKQNNGLRLEIACYNAEQSFVLAGDTASVDALKDLLSSSKTVKRWKRLQVPNAFHSVLAEHLVKPLQETAERYTYHEAEIPVETCSKSSNWLCATPALVASHLRDPVYFHEAARRIADQLGSCTWLEAGSGSSAPLIRRALGAQASADDILSMCPNPASPLSPLAATTAELWRLGLPVQFWPFHNIQHHEFKVLNLPPYEFDKFRHWLDWIETGAPEPNTISSTYSGQSQLLRLVKKTEDEGKFLINTRSGDWNTMCSDYRILGVSSCPLSSVLQIISKAIDEFQQVAEKSHVAYHLQSLTMQAPIPADFNTDLSLSIAHGEKSQTWSFALMGGSNSHVEFARGTVNEAQASSETTRKEFARFQRLINHEKIRRLMLEDDVDSVKGRAVYRSFGTLFHIPHSQQGIKEVSMKGEEAAAYLQTSIKCPFMAIETFLQVPLICLNSLRDHRDDEMYISTGIGDATFADCINWSTNQDTQWAIYVSFSGLEDAETTSDIFVFDSSTEKLSVVLLDVHLKRARTESVRQALGSSIVQSSLVHDDGHSEAMSPKQAIDRSPEFSTTPEPEPELRPVLSYPSSHVTKSPSIISKSLYELLARVADIDRDSIRDDVLIADLGIDSLMGMEVAAELSKTFSITIGVREFEAVTDVGSLCILVSKMTGGSHHNLPKSNQLLGDDPGASESSSSSLRGSTPDTQLSADEDDCRAMTNTLSEKGITVLPLEAVVSSFNAIHSQFDAIAKTKECDQFFSRVYPFQASLVVAVIVEAFAKLGCKLDLVNEGSTLPDITHLPKHNRLLMRFMAALQDDGLIAQTGRRWVRTAKAIPNRPSSEIYEQLQSEFPQFASEHQLMYAIGSQLGSCLSGQSEALTILFGTPQRRALMAEQYMNAPIQASVSQQLVSFISKAFGMQHIQGTARVLEIGGGTCGTSIPVVRALAQLGIPVEYTFSDISPSFVSAAKNKLREYSFVAFRTLDVTEDPGFSEDRYDMIIATNVIHATPNARQSASNIRKLLKPGGFLALVEYTWKSYYLLDVTFGLLDGWWLFNDGRTHALMNEEEWKRTLTGAGFTMVDWTRGESEESKICKIIIAY